ncbi:MAG: hypothetical protein QHI38_13610 [Armatimonadota bacterium]|nr:hypothetical protein [Armatimonadota bacterium]
MIGAVHTIVGAAVGTLTASKPRAFLVGVLSHLITDAVPHKDCSPAAEVSLLGAALSGIAAWKGVDSPEFWGAVGGIIPDVEHGLAFTRLMSAQRKVFPTHVGNGKYHGRKTRDRWSQLIVTAASILVLIASDRRRS